MRVRVNNYTNVHAVVETKDGKLVETAKFVKASGGCSAPMGMSDEEAMKGMGDMRMKFSDGQGGKPVEATLMVRHPNFSGMQMNQVTRDYTPARYVDKLDVTHGDQLVFHLDGDISIASNPVIHFGIKPDGKGPSRSRPPTTRVDAGSTNSSCPRRATDAMRRRAGNAVHFALGLMIGATAAAAAPADSPVNVPEPEGLYTGPRTATRPRPSRARR